MIEEPKMNDLVANESRLITLIRAQQNSLRLLGIVPGWYAFTQSEVFWEFRKAGFTNREKAKYQAWWTFLFAIMRNKDDKETVQYGVACLIAEKARRSYGKTIPVQPKSFGLSDDEHATRVREYVLEHYEGLNPN